MPGVGSGVARRMEYELKHFIEQTAHEEAVYRWGAAEALGRIGDRRAVPYLLPLLEDEDWRVRLKAAWSLGRIGEPDALPALGRLARDRMDAVRDMAKESSQAIMKRMISSQSNVPRNGR